MFCLKFDVVPFGLFTIDLEVGALDSTPFSVVTLERQASALLLFRAEIT